MTFARGSEWGKWDLHVHTPASLQHQYNGNDDATWERFIADLEALPPSFRVLGINDYIFIDGYRRLCKEKAAGRLSNITTLLPVVELRIDKFGGTESQLRRVNLHIVFDDALGADLIQSQFLNALSASYQLAPDAGAGSSWSGIVDKQSLQDMGAKIIASVPDAEKKRFGTPLLEGFNNLTLGLDKVRQILEGSYFRDRHLVAVGRAEWAAIKWNDHAIADKKDVINRAHIIFTAAASSDSAYAARDALKAAGVKHCVLDCSDAHHFSTSEDKDRIGNCLTWIKADPTFNGLRHALREYDARVFIGHRPPKLALVDANPTSFAQRITIRKGENSKMKEAWFDCDIPLNVDLVAVIGNRGSGKSALADTLGLLGNARSFPAHASFLNAQKFCSPKDNKAREFCAELMWEGAKSTTKLTLNATTVDERPELVKYLPQNFLESICNAIPKAGEPTSFDALLKATVFSHISSADRHGKLSLDSLIEFRTSEMMQSLTHRRAKLSAHVHTLMAQRKRATPAFRAEREAELVRLDAALSALDSKKPVEVKPPAPSGDDAVAIEERDQLAAEWVLKGIEGAVLESQLGVQSTQAETGLKLRSAMRNLKTMFDDAVEEMRKGAASLQLEIRSVVAATFDEAQVDVRTQEALSAVAETKLAIATNLRAMEDLRVRGQAIVARLKEPQQRYAAYVAEVDVWQRSRDALIGAKGVPSTRAFVAAELAALATANDDVIAAVATRDNTSKSIFSGLKELAGTYGKLYKPVSDFVAAHEVVRQKFNLEVGVNVVDAGFGDRFFDFVSRQVAGSFCGTTEGQRTLDGLLAVADFQTEAGALTFAHTVEEHLVTDMRVTGRSKTELASQVRKGHSAEELLAFIYGFSYLEPRYVLRLGTRELHQLSPGERGLLLLVFHLLVDQTTCPIVIDQPEENLDNQTIYDLLVPCIRAAKERRQVIIVTHNPNLAVVCDAEQIISAKLDPEDRNRITYTSGSIENPEINAEIVRVLEGTMPAFDNRRGKYLPVGGGR